MNWRKDMDECSYDNKVDFFWFHVLGGCGCGSSDELSEIAWDVFLNFSKDHESRASLYDDPAREIVGHWIDSLGLIEHGSGISGSWLTDEGKELLDAINSDKFKPTEILERKS